MDGKLLTKFNLPAELQDIVNSTEILIPQSRSQLFELAFQESDKEIVEVAYELPNGERFVEATVARCKNGAAVNYTEAYMRRRDPDATLIGDDYPTDKIRFADKYQQPFESIRKEAFQWLKKQNRLVFLPFFAGDKTEGYPILLVAPDNAGFFIAGLADLQGFIPKHDIRDDFTPVSIIYLIPPFRHTHFDGKQVVVHNRMQGMHELFSFNLYPGPSAKKGVYGILLTLGETEGWVTLHSSAVRMITPYDNEFVIMHEGASGGGKSEMAQPLHREEDGRILLGVDTITSEKVYLELMDICELHPVTDDMALAHPSLQDESRKLVIEDAEAGWFLRVDHMDEYGIEPSIEKLCIKPPEPLIFLNIDAKPGATALIWEHYMDSPGKPCPNPRVIMPRAFIKDIVNEPVQVDVRSFGVRTPPCTKETPNYGIIGLLHILPPALAWLWRLVAPRGHANPSIVTSEGLISEGVGSYWPFATGTKVRQANLLLKQIQMTPRTKYVLIPNQYIGAYRVGFSPEWIAREYLARRGNLKFRPGQIMQARCPILGFTIGSMRINGQMIPKGLLSVHEQLEVGFDGYDEGAEILTEFFHKEIKQFYTKDLLPMGKKIINLCLNNGSAEEYAEIFEYLR